MTETQPMVLTSGGWKKRIIKVLHIYNFIYTYIFEILDELKNFLNVAVFAILGVIIRGLFQLQTNVCWFKYLGTKGGILYVLCL